MTVFDAKIRRCNAVLKSSINPERINARIFRRLYAILLTDCTKYYRYVKSADLLQDIKYTTIIPLYHAKVSGQIVSYNYAGPRKRASGVSLSKLTQRA